jgi:hypothetical protein
LILHESVAAWNCSINYKSGNLVPVLLLVTSPMRAFDKFDLMDGPQIVSLREPFVPRTSEIKHGRRL